MPKSPGVLLLACWAACVALLLAPAASADEPRRATLAYTIAPGIDGCFERAELEDAVAARLGYVPFVEGAGAERPDVTIGARVRRQGAAGLSAELEVREGSESRTRELGSSTGDCGELSRALALAISVAVDPLSLIRVAQPERGPEAAAQTEPGLAARPEAAPAPTPAPGTAAAPAPKPASPPAPPRELSPPAPAWRVRWLATGHASLLALPGPSGGGSLGLGVRRRSLWLDTEVRYDAPARTEAEAGGSVRASLLGGAVSGCTGVGRVLGLCALGLIARLAGEGIDVALPKSDASLLAALGARLSLELPLTEKLFARAHLDGLYLLTPTELTLRGRTVWDASPVSLVPGLGLGGQLP